MNVFQYEYFEYYIKIGALGILPQLLSTFYLKLMNLADKGIVVVIISLLTVFLYIGICYFFIVDLNLAALGISLCNVAVKFFLLVLVILYYIYDNPIPGAIFCLRKESFSLKGLYEVFKTYSSCLIVILAFGIKKFKQVLYLPY